MYVRETCIFTYEKYRPSNHLISRIPLKLPLSQPRLFKHKIKLDIIRFFQFPGEKIRLSSRTSREFQSNPPRRPSPTQKTHHLRTRPLATSTALRTRHCRTPVKRESVHAKAHFRAPYSIQQLASRMNHPRPFCLRGPLKTLSNRSIEQGGARKKPFFFRLFRTKRAIIGCRCCRRSERR